MNPSDISIQDYTYPLPEDKIALHPLAERDAAKLLVYRQGKITQSTFADISGFLPDGAMMLFNNTKVINARLRFKKPSGTVIEIFCLEPQGEFTTYSSVMASTGIVVWKCFVGGAFKWKEDFLEKKLRIHDGDISLKARLLEKKGDAYLVEFSWDAPNISFANIIETAGDVPLPPYIKRSTDTEDTSRYQTIFAASEGSVAAPTAGLHFTQNIFNELSAKHIRKSFVTLHVGAGTFKPVKAESMAGHEMHAEYIDVNKEVLQELVNNEGKIVAVGTTSLRTIESLYWLGVKVYLDPTIKNLRIDQWDVYQAPLSDSQVSMTQALQALYQWMTGNKAERLFTQTQLLIVPGYTFRVADILVTNFHQPQSTLLLLVAAAIGNQWKELYDYALNNDFRFLSYGDGNLIFIEKHR